MNIFIDLASDYMTTTVAAVATVAATTAYLYRDELYHTAEKITTCALSTNFYTGYKTLSPDVATSRRDNLFTTYGAHELSCFNAAGKNIDAVYIPATSAEKTGNVIVICLNTTYQDHHPRHFEPFLASGADVVVWNTTSLTPKAYSDDLLSVLRKMKESNPDQTVAVTTYCASSDPAIKAVANLGDPNTHLIIDRGHGDTPTLARSFTTLAGTSFLRSMIHADFDCAGAERIKEIRGRAIFLTPRELDQVMDYGSGRNLTRDLHVIRSRADDRLIELENSGHWTSLDYQSFNQILEFLEDLGIVIRDFPRVTQEAFPTAPPLGDCQKRWIPFLTKAWC
ncbi:MAG: hypothetical protein HY860_02215 [Chlamydiales bacterium]|nr:hypothetical protein [Chlamydiales bacterium]